MPSSPVRGIRGPLDPRIAGEADGHAEVGDAADAAANQTDRTRGDTIVNTVEKARKMRKATAAKIL